MWSKGSHLNIHVDIWAGVEQGEEIVTWAACLLLSIVMFPSGLTGRSSGEEYVSHCSKQDEIEVGMDCEWRPTFLQAQSATK